MPPSPRLPRHRTASTTIALVAIVLAQALGLMHRIAHAHPSAPWASAVTWTQAAAADRSTDWLHALFNGHHHDGDCDAYDRLTPCDAIKSVPATLASAAAPMAPRFPPPTSQTSTRHAAFLARAPPLVA